MVTSPSVPWPEIDEAARRRLAVDGVAPRYHLRPGSAEELAAVLRAADAAGLAVAPRGGGTQLQLGNRPARVDVVVEMGGLDRVIEYEPADLTVTVEAGMRFADVQDLLRARGQFLALDPPALPQATIGGIIATNASGPLRFAYGTARDLVIGTRVANADGRLTRAGGRVVKNVAGYDLNKLYVGSLGTLGVLVELSFKLHPIPPRTGLVVGAFPTSEAAHAFIGAVVRSPLGPLAVELLGPAAAFTAGLARERSVALRVGGYPQAVERQERDLRALVAEHGGSVRDTAGDDTWRAIQYLAQWADRDVLIKAAVPLARSSAVVDALEQALEPFEPLVWAHAGSGIVYAACHSQVGGGKDFPQRSEFGRGKEAQWGEVVWGAAPRRGEAGSDASISSEATDMRGILADLRQHVRALGGGNSSLVVERCPPGLKEGFDVWGDPGDGLPLMRTLKQQLDSRSTLNPGRSL